MTYATAIAPGHVHHEDYRGTVHVTDELTPRYVIDCHGGGHRYISQTRHNTAAQALDAGAECLRNTVCHMCATNR